jgi:3-hydroxyisobutyrate dehydrogenase-like beta-hydroxyacid dehydrogenase
LFSAVFTIAVKQAAVAGQAQVLILSLPSADALRSVVQECALVAPAQRGQIVMETSTLPLADKLGAARELRRQGRVMLDAPISGTATPSPETTWIMYLSGPVAACRRAARLARAFTLSAPRVGPLGSGIKLKIAANHLVAVYNVACAEMVALCQAMGLDPQVALQHMGSSPYIGTGLMRLRMPMMIQREYLPATMKMGLWQKDMQVIGDMARAARCQHRRIVRRGHLGCHPRRPPAHSRGGGRRRRRARPGNPHVGR